ncbi:hypothetical protein, partial [Kingella kingae]|uniref:hypothetical protein n=1 Tax=Kingella kingae TaxID=504 RepID=UPI002552F2B4
LAKWVILIRQLSRDHGNGVRVYVWVHSEYGRNPRAESRANRFKQPNCQYAERETLAGVPMQQTNMCENH